MGVSTGIRVVSLERSAARREAFARQAADAGLDWDFFPACTGVVEPLTYDAARAARRFGRELSAPEIGCYASHYKIWQWLVQSEHDQVIVFEDDVLIDWPAIRKICGQDFHAMGLDLVRLFATHPINWEMARYRFLSPHHHLVWAKGATFGTQAYLITKAGAKVLVERFGDLRMPVDWVLTRYWDHGVPGFAITPFPAIEQFVPSTIEGTMKPASSAPASGRIARKYQTILEKFQRLHYHRFRMPKLAFDKGNDAGPSLI